MTPRSAVSGAVLAGGRSSRMGGRHKALVSLAGRPLLRHVIDRVAPQVQDLLLSVEHVDPLWTPFGLRQVADPLPGHRGPLGGLLAALQATAGRTDWLLLLPCDAPFLPPDLAARLVSGAEQAAMPGAVIRLDAVLQPTFSLWHCSLVEPLAGAVHVDGLGGFMAFLDRCPLAIVDADNETSADLPPFFNVNTPADLVRAEAWLRLQDGSRLAC